MKKTLVKLSPLALLPTLPLVATVSCSNNQASNQITPPEVLVMHDEKYPLLEFNSKGEVWLKKTETISEEEGKNFIIPDILTNTDTLWPEYMGFQMKPTKIAYESFKDQKSLSSIKLPESIIDISSYSFSGTNLIEIAIPSLTTSIGYEAFFNCDKLSKITFSKNSRLIYIYINMHFMVHL